VKASLGKVTENLVSAEGGMLWAESHALWGLDRERLLPDRSAMIRDLLHRIGD
jgi:hypothetical protein